MTSGKLKVTDPRQAENPEPSHLFIAYRMSEGIIESPAVLHSCSGSLLFWD